MLNIKNCRRILRAKSGSQIPKYSSPAGGINLLSGDLSGSFGQFGGFNFSQQNPVGFLRQFETPVNNPYLTSSGLTTPYHTTSPSPENNNFFKNLLGSTSQALSSNTGQGIANMVSNGLNTVSQLTGKNVVQSTGVKTGLQVANGILKDTPFKAFVPAIETIGNIFGSKVDPYSYNRDVASKVGGSYSGSYDLITKAEEDSGKKYWFGIGAGKARDNIKKASNMEQKLTNISDTYSDQKSMVNNLTYNQNIIDLNGGFNPKYMRAAKNGMKLQDKIDFIINKRFQSRINVNTRQVEEFKEGGQIDWEPKIISEIECFKDGGQIEWEPEIILDIQEFQQGGKTEELETSEIEETNQKNLIPEGALHKNKHHMEHTDGLTQKGIPVIDNEGEQQAEIELNEIIFTLEVTKKLEELYKDGSDEAAIKAGKLLVDEILFNTDDRTNLIAKCEKGGKLNGIT